MRKKVKKAKHKIRQTKEVKKLASFMKKYELSQNAISKIVSVSQACVSLWMRTGNIKKEYFDKLKKWRDKKYAV